MKRFFPKIISTIKLLGKIIFLLALLALTWGLVSVSHLTRKNGGSSPSGGEDFRSRLSSAFYQQQNEARADAPGGIVPCSKTGSTPFLAYFDGKSKSYKLENDIMFGRPKSYYHSYEVAKSLYEDGRIWPDLYKITAPLKSFANQILLQIQEIELEESFFKRLELKRVVHPKNTEVIVDSEYKKFYVVDKSAFQKNIVLPFSIQSKNGVNYSGRISDKKSIFDTLTDSGDYIRFEKADSIEIVFSNLKVGETPYLVVKSWFRDWVLGLEEDWKEEKNAALPAFLRHSLTRTISSSLFFFGSFAGVLPFPPFFMSFTADCGSTGSTGSTGESTSVMCPGIVCSFVYEYRNEAGYFSTCAISEPRAWHYNTEVIELPKEAVLKDGTLRLRISSSKRHILGFVGLVQQIDELTAESYEEENLELTKAYHHRLEKDLADSLKDATGQFVQTIPGDKIDLEFSAPKVSLKKREKETYLIRASGFYTSLRGQSRALAGNWQDRISDEAKARLAFLKPLRNYR
jgi:hypothetical protein